MWKTFEAVKNHLADEAARILSHAALVFITAFDRMQRLAITRLVARALAHTLVTFKCRVEAQNRADKEEREH